MVDRSQAGMADPTSDASNVALKRWRFVQEPHEGVLHDETLSETTKQKQDETLLAYRSRVDFLVSIYVLDLARDP